MADTKRILRSILSFSLIAASVLGLINVYGDNTEVLNLAKRTACGDKECPTHLTELSRTPITQTFTLVAEEAKAKRVTHIVKCQREQFLLGEWRCSDQR